MGLCSFFLSSQDELEKEVKQGKTVNLELVFGYHWKPGSGTSVGFYHVTARSRPGSHCDRITV